MTLEGWEYTLCERTLPGTPDPERRLLVTVRGGLGWAGLGWAGLGWAGLGGLGWVRCWALLEGQGGGEAVQEVGSAVLEGAALPTV